VEGAAPERLKERRTFSISGFVMAGPSALSTSDGSCPGRAARAWLESSG
jgi:hypothetical protein